MSGFVRERVLDLEQLGARAEFINKPFTKSTLLAALDRALASPPAPSASVAPAIPAPAPGRA
jgi:FixJ family two-component response regulator